MNEQAISMPSRSQMDDESHPIFRTSNVTLAESIRLLLALEDVRAAVIQGDPLQLGVAIVDVVVLAEEHKKAKQILDASRTPNHTEDWHCSDCDEAVPMSFDICWNCGRLHPEIVGEDFEHTTSKDEMYEWDVVRC